MITATLARRFHQTLRRTPTQRACPDHWPSFEPVPAMLDSCHTALALNVLDPDALIDYYGAAMPEALLTQLFSNTPLADLLWRPLDLARLPRLHAALTGAFAALRAHDLDPEACLGAADPSSLLAAEPTLAHLYADALFGSGLPMIGATPQHGQVIARHLASHDPDATLDLWLSGNILHERFHGRRSASSRPTSWMLQECAAIHLGWTAHPPHVLPSLPGEAVPAGAPFLMVAQTLAHHLGARALWATGLLGGQLSDHATPRVCNALAVAEWQCLRAQRRPQFAPDGHRPTDWIKLIDAACGSSPLDPLLDGLAALTDPLSATGPVIHGPDLLTLASQLTWPQLPWYLAPLSDADLDLVRPAVRSLFRVNRYDDTFQTLPDPLPGDRLVLDVHNSLLLADHRPHGIYDEPARWLFPPPLTRKLAQHGVDTVVVTNATLQRADQIADLLTWTALDERPLPRHVTIAL